MIIYNILLAINIMYRIIETINSIDMFINIYMYIWGISMLTGIVYICVVCICNYHNEYMRDNIRYEYKYG